MKSVFELIEEHGLTLHGDIEHFAELVRDDEKKASDQLVAVYAQQRPPLITTTTSTAAVELNRKAGEGEEA